MIDFVSDTTIEKLWSRSLEQFNDNRGRYLEIFRTRSSSISIPEMVQDSLSESAQGVVRGMHIQLGQWQLVTILQGEILDVVIDLDSRSTSYMHIKSCQLSSKGLNQLLIGPGIAHGFRVLSDNCLISYKSSKYYGETPQFGINVNSPEFSDYFSGDDILVSVRDSLFPELSKVATDTELLGLMKS